MPKVPFPSNSKVRAFCEKVITDEVYQFNLIKALKERTVHPSVETMIWYYAAGAKPTEHVSLDATPRAEKLIDMSREELVNHLDSLKTKVLGKTETLH